MMLIPLIKYSSVSNNDLLLDLQSQCLLDISSRHKHFIFSPVTLTIFCQVRHCHCPCQRLLTRTIFASVPRYWHFSIRPSWSLWNPPSSISIAPNLITCSWTSAKTSHQSFCLHLFPFQSHHRNCLQVSQSFLSTTGGIQNNPNKQFQRHFFFFLSGGSIVRIVHGFLGHCLGKGHTCVLRLTKLSPSLDTLEPHHSSCWDAEFHFVIHTQGAPPRAGCWATDTLVYRIILKSQGWKKLFLKEHWFCLGFFLYIFTVVLSSSKIIVFISSLPVRDFMT